MLASWDAEEFTLTSSTEWGEQYAEALQRRAVAYINVDSAASGPVFSASAVPSLNRLVAEAARDVRDRGIAPVDRAGDGACRRGRSAVRCRMRRGKAS